MPPSFYGRMRTNLGTGICVKNNELVRKNETPY
jgi:hypothetical protein